MRKDRGIIFVAFGKEYDKLAANTLKYSRKFTDLPFYVLTNLEKRDGIWNGISDVTFKFIPLAANENRKVKVSIINYSPFDETLYIDVDAVIQRFGIEEIFDLLKISDVVCQSICQPFSPKTELQRKIYDKMATALGESFPINRICGGIYLFKKSENSFQFFSLWEKYYELNDTGRDMPALCFAVKHCSSFIKILKENDKVNLFHLKENNKCFVQHNNFSNWGKKFGISSYERWIPPLGDK